LLRFLGEKLVLKIIFNIFKVGYINFTQKGICCYNIPLFSVSLSPYKHFVMKFIGLFFLVIGLVSVGLGLVGYNSLLLSWVNNWGEGIGWGIKLGATALGGILYFVYRHQD
jgi:hypothetical protein